MCGIAGVLGKDLSVDEIKKCQDNLKKRGPDNKGFYKKKNITLIHTRLSILDLSPYGNQPIIDKNSGTVLIYNGEIYNFKELQKLIDPNEKATNDSRVILNLYLKYGLDSFKMLRGMFALAIWEEKSQTLIIARDRFGIKPIYYSYINGVFYFASETKALNSVGVKKQIDNKSLKNYLVNGILENNSNTLFENISPLKPGTIMTIKENNISENSFWNKRNLKKIEIRKNEIGEAISEKLLEVCKLHLISDVKLGITLSSGIDSQLLLNLMVKLQQDINTYTYGYENKEYDEAEYVNEKYNKYNLKMISSVLHSKDLFDELEEAIEYFQNPLGGLGTLSLFHLMKSIKQDSTKVILSGEGGDEVFLGYKYYFYAYLLDLKNTNQIKKLKNEILNWKILTNEDLNSDLSISNLFENKIYGSKAPDGTLLTSNSLDGEFLRNIKIDNLEKKFEKNHLENLNILDIEEKKLPKLLMFQDRCSMFSGIESRVPFLDHELYEMVKSVEATHHINNGQLKNILRNELSKSTKTEVEKKYVAAPQREWLKYELSTKVKEMIFDGYLVNNKIINKNNFFDQYDEYIKSNKLGNSFFIWKILNLEMLLNLK